MALSPSLIKNWFALQRRLIAGLKVAYVDLRGSELPQGGFVVTYPDELGQAGELALAARLAVQSGAPVSGRGMALAEGVAALRIACPLKLNGQLGGAVVVEVEGPAQRQAEVLKLLRWSEGWLRLAVRQDDAAEGTVDYRTLIDAGLVQDDFDAALTAVLALTPSRVGCTRLGLGGSRSGRVQLLGVSEVGELAPRSPRVKAVEKAMQEALATGRALCWPAGDEAEGDGEAARRLVEAAGLHGVCCVPVSGALSEPLVFVFEFAGDAPWHNGTPRRCIETAYVLAPLLTLRREHDSAWWGRLGALLREGMQRLAGPRGRMRRALLAAGALLVAVYALGEAPYRVAASAVVEGAVQRAVVAPFDGYVADALVRAGQQVAAGELLARLDDRELQNERRRLAAEEGELADEHRQAVALLDHGKSKVLEAQLAQTRARLALLEDRLARTELRAPLEGVVITGDWSRSLGVPIARGELLFEIAPLDAYRVAIQVPDRDIAALDAGQTGELILAALPRRPVALRVTGIAALAPEELAEPSFRVEAELVEGGAMLRPGMEGIAKVAVGERPRWWIWTHRLTDWLRLQLWRWWP